MPVAVVMIRRRNDAAGGSLQETTLACRRAEAAAKFLQQAGVSFINRQPGLSTRTASNAALDQTSEASASPADAKRSAKAPPSDERSGTDINSMRSARDTAEKRRAIPPVEDRFNVKRIGLVEKEYHFRATASGSLELTNAMSGLGRIRSLPESGRSHSAVDLNESGEVVGDVVPGNPLLALQHRRCRIQ